MLASLGKRISSRDVIYPYANFCANTYSLKINIVSGRFGGANFFFSWFLPTWSVPTEAVWTRTMYGTDDVAGSFSLSAYCCVRLQSNWPVLVGPKRSSLLKFIMWLSHPVFMWIGWVIKWKQMCGRSIYVADFCGFSIVSTSLPPLLKPNNLATSGCALFVRIRFHAHK